MLGNKAWLTVYATSHPEGVGWGCDQGSALFFHTKLRKPILTSRKSAFPTVVTVGNALLFIILCVCVCFFFYKDVP